MLFLLFIFCFDNLIGVAGEVAEQGIIGSVCVHADPVFGFSSTSLPNDRQ